MGLDVHLYPCGHRQPAGDGPTVKNPPCHATRAKSAGAVLPEIPIDPVSRFCPCRAPNQPGTFRRHPCSLYHVPLSTDPLCHATPGTRPTTHAICSTTPQTSARRFPERHLPSFFAAAGSHCCGTRAPLQPIQSRALLVRDHEGGTGRIPSHPVQRLPGNFPAPPACDAVYFPQCDRYGAGVALRLPGLQFPDGQS